MKKFLLLTIALLAVKIFAGDPEFHGNFLAALEEDNPRIRAGMIISALEAAKSPVSDRNALSILCYDLEGDGFDRPLMLRMITLMKKNPADFELASMIFSIGVFRNFCPDELLTAFAETVLTVKIKNLKRQDLLEMMRLLEKLCPQLLASGKFELCSKIFDTLFADIDSPGMLNLLARWSNQCMFNISDTAPGFRGYKELPDTDFWKSRQLLLTGYLMQKKARYPEEAASILDAMLLLNLPQTPEKFRQYQTQFPEYNWRGHADFIALKFARPDLTSIRIDSWHTFVSACEMKQFRSAKRWIRKQKRSSRASWYAYYYSAKKEYRKVLKMLNRGDIDLKEMNIFVMMAVADTIHVTQSAEWCKRLIYEVERRGANTLPEFANTAGYIAADLGIELDRAEQLLRAAVNADPASSAYRDSLAWVLFRQKKYHDAAQEMEIALKFRPVSSSVSVIFFHAAEIQLALGNKAEAVKLFDRALKIHDFKDDASKEYTPERVNDLEKRLK